MFLLCILKDHRTPIPSVMAFQPQVGKISWKVHFSSTIEKVYKALSTDAGRKTFWAEETVESAGKVVFTIFNYSPYTATIIEQVEPVLFRIEYFGTDVTFNLLSTEDGGTDLLLTAIVPNEQLKAEMTAGWVSVLMAMKAAVDFGVDLRNHHPERVWDKGFLDN